MIVFYVTGHGFGHATRASALACALKALRPGLCLEIRTSAPAWIFQEQCPGLPVLCFAADPGMAQKDALDIDLEASLAAQEALNRDWGRLIEGQAAALRAQGARLVVSDIAPLAFEAAAQAGVPSVGVSNFCWDWIFAPYAARDPRWEPARRRCAEAYALAEGALRLPLHGQFPSFRRLTDVPLLCRLGRTTPQQWRAARGLPADRRPIVLLAFGGFGVGPLRLTAQEDLRGFLFAGFGAPPAGLRGDWVSLRGGTSADQLDAMAACDVVLSKPGYGIVSEALAHGKRMLYLPREDFREIDGLIGGLERRGSCAPLERADFFAGRWRRALEALMAQPQPAAVAADGAAVAARALLGRLDGAPLWP